MCLHTTLLWGSKGRRLASLLIVLASLLSLQLYTTIYAYYYIGGLYERTLLASSSSYQNTVCVLILLNMCPHAKT